MSLSFHRQNIVFGSSTAKKMIVRLEAPSRPLSIQREQSASRRVALITLTLFLGSQLLAPLGVTLSSVRAETKTIQREARAGNATALGMAAKTGAVAPAWFESAQQQQNVLLAQSEKRRAEILQQATENARRLDCPECEVDVRAMDLSRPPTEKELRKAGQLGGALSPTDIANPQELAWKLDQFNAKAGRRQQIAPEEIMARVERLKAINLSFGKAIQEWNKHNFRIAAAMFQKHLDDYPDSPWAGEAQLHLGCDAKYNGRFSEAQERYDFLLRNTSSNPDDPSFDIHQKAKLRWADLDMGTGDWKKAGAKLADIIKTDDDWRRRTWARHWMRNLSMYKANARDLRACGAQALSVVMASLGKNKQAEHLAQIKPKNSDGFSLGEMAVIAQQNGVPMYGFRAKPNQLASLPTPFILHYDYNGSNKISVEELQKKSTPGAAPFRLSGRTGHFLVAQKVDAKNKRVRLYDPQQKRLYHLSFKELQREWSGAGLTLAKNNMTQAQPARLSRAEMKDVIGGCCGVPRKQDDLGWQCINGRWVKTSCANCGCGANSSKGEPIVGVNLVNLNMYVEDTPMWYSTPVGPDVEIRMSYNSQDATSQNKVFGNKWVFNYGTYLVEDTGVGGGVVTVFMPDGRQDNYTPDGSGGYNREAGVTSTLVKLATNSYELRFQDGSKFVYGIPAGTTSLQPFLVRVEDRWGYGLNFGYNADVKLTTITDAQNKVTTLTYDEAGHITQVKDPFERVVSFTYNAGGDLVEAVDMDGHAFQYVYDMDKRITILNTPQGEWKFRHEGPDSNSNPGMFYPAPDADMWENVRLTITDPENQKEEYYYVGTGTFINGEMVPYSWYVDKKNYVDYVSNTRNNSISTVAKTTFVHNQTIDGKGKITQVTYPDGDSEHLAYDSTTGLPTQIIDARDKATTFTYNSQLQIKTVTNPRNYTTTYNYAANGLDLESVTNALNQTPATISYNAKHQPTQVSNALGETSTLTYTNWGAVETVTEPGNHVTTYNYDPTTKRLSSVTQDGVTVASFTYDEIGRVKTATDVSNFTVGYEYNNLDQLTKTTYPDGTFEKVDRVCCGLPGVVTDRSGRKAYFDYDQLKRLRRVQDASGHDVNYTYDADGRLTRLADSKNNWTRWRYDSSGRPTHKFYDDGSFEQISYFQGMVSSVRDAQGRITTFNYDDNGNTRRINYPNSPDVSTVYDELDRVQSVTDGLGTTTFGYDVLSRVRTIDGPWANDTVTYNFDNQSRPDWMQVQNSDATQFQTSFAYDALDRLQSVTSAAGVWGFGYVGNTGRLSTQTQPNGTVTNYAYDSLLRLSGVENLHGAAQGNALISRYVYGYSDAGHKDSRSQVQSQVGANPLQQVNYGYDAIDQLLSEVSSEATPLLNKSYGYDAMGNRTVATNNSALGGYSSSPQSTSYAANNLNQLTSYTSTQNGTNSTYNLTYDAPGNLRQSQKAGDANPHTEYSYDDLDRLTQVVQRDGSGALWKKSEYAYDYASRKAISREYSHNGTAWNLDNEKRRIYSGMDVVQERDGSNVTTANITRLGNIGGILSRTTYGTGGGHFYYHYDGGGNVVQLTDSTQTPVAEYSYDAYGVTLTSTGPKALENPYRYQTKEVTQAGYDFGFRFYSPGLGRWLNRDPIREAGGLNLYGYISNNPVNSFDPYGLSEGLPAPRPWVWKMLIPGYGLGFFANMAAQVLGAGFNDCPPNGFDESAADALGNKVGDVVGVASGAGAIKSIGGAGVRWAASRGASKAATHVALDNNALIPLLEGTASEAATVTSAMAGRAASVPPRAAAEYMVKGDARALSEYLHKNGGRIANSPCQATVQSLTKIGLKAGDAQVVGSAMDEGIELLTRDKQLLKKVPGTAKPF
jgi:RHS repeat-associated protein